MKTNPCKKLKVRDMADRKDAKDKTRITLSMSLEQAKYLSTALETLARIGSGQFKELCRLIRGWDMSWDEMQEIENYLKEKLLPELTNKWGCSYCAGTGGTNDGHDGKDVCVHCKGKGYLFTSNSYNGIHSDKVPEESKIAWDAYQWLRREIAWNRHGKDWRVDNRDWTGGANSMIGVSYDEPMKTSKIAGTFKTEIKGGLTNASTNS